MSLEIDTAKVNRILLPDRKWHEVEKGSFDLDAYEYEASGQVVFKGGQDKQIPSTGASWREPDPKTGKVRKRCCPLTSILAVEHV